MSSFQGTTDVSRSQQVTKGRKTDPTQTNPTAHANENGSSAMNVWTSLDQYMFNNKATANKQGSVRRGASLDDEGPAIEEPGNSMDMRGSSLRRVSISQGSIGESPCRQERTVSRNAANGLSTSMRDELGRRIDFGGRTIEQTLQQASQSPGPRQAHTSHGGGKRKNLKELIAHIAKKNAMQGQGVPSTPIDQRRTVTLDSTGKGGAGDLAQRKGEQTRARTQMSGEPAEYLKAECSASAKLNRLKKQYQRQLKKQGEVSPAQPS